MDRWAGKVAIVTGASSGIGAAVSKVLVGHGVKVVGLARRVNRLQEMSAKLGKDKFYPIECDVTQEENITRAFKWIEKELGGADILINNAGLATNSMVIDSPTEEYRKVLETNLLAPAIFSREFSQSAKKRNVPAHIVNINSIAGQYAESIHMPIGMYASSKYGLHALGTELRHEFILANLKIKVTNISPGVVLTEMVRSVMDEIPKSLPALQDKDIADAVIYALGTPHSVEIPEITIIPQGAAIGISQSDLTEK